MSSNFAQKYILPCTLTGKTILPITAFFKPPWRLKSVNSMLFINFDRKEINITTLWEGERYLMQNEWIVQKNKDRLVKITRYALQNIFYCIQLRSTRYNHLVFMHFCEAVSPLLPPFSTLPLPVFREATFSLTTSIIANILTWTST